jgi:N12 class adenine-specific DNA methylase
MAMAAMELRRLGLVHKPAFVVPNHMLDQFSQELAQLYPLAKILVADRDGLPP